MDFIFWVLYIFLNFLSNESYFGTFDKLLFLQLNDYFVNIILLDVNLFGNFKLGEADFS